MHKIFQNWAAALMATMFRLTAVGAQQDDFASKWPREPLPTMQKAAQAQGAGCKNSFCWEVYPPGVPGGDTLIKITKWPRSTHRNIRWDCEAGGCQVEGDMLHLRAGVNTSALQVS